MSYSSVTSSPVVLTAIFTRLNVLLSSFYSRFSLRSCIMGKNEKIIQIQDTQKKTTTKKEQDWDILKHLQFQDSWSLTRVMAGGRVSVWWQTEARQSSGVYTALLTWRLTRLKGIYKFGRTSGAVGGVGEATGAGEKDRRAIKDPALTLPPLLLHSLPVWSIRPTWDKHRSCIKTEFTDPSVCIHSCVYGHEISATSPLPPPWGPGVCFIGSSQHVGDTDNHQPH